MLIHSLPLFLTLGLFATTAAAQSVQNNNQGVIVNVIAPAPVYSQPIYLPEIHRSTAAELQAETDAYLARKASESARESREAGAPAPKAPASFYFVARARTEVILRAAPDAKSARVTIIPARGSISVDGRGGFLPNGWSAVSFLGTSTTISTS